ncbi:MAG TPA: hypothetical protein VFU22_20885 [Roseiflexaceae bacterium]|nr:hypothetical protein [Roseiflexaceae bacterium]
MTYFPDLSPLTYFGKADADKLVAVGWLDEAHPYSQGEVSQTFLDRLVELLAKPWAPAYLLGFHECPWCGEDADANYNGRSITVGALNLYVPGDGFLYVMPSLALHYIQAHGYAPPQEFCEAVLRCPTMRSREYFEAIAANAPQRYADSVAKHYLSQE